MNEHPALALLSVSRRFSEGGRVVPVLEGVDLRLERGEIVGLIGPSGSGKTTLLQVAGLLDRPDAGEVAIGGRAMAGKNDRLRTLMRRDHIGFVYQFHHLLGEFSAQDNVAMPMRVAGMRAKDARARAGALLERVGLAARARHRPGEMSGGERQRVALCRALANRPELLLADEPTGNLDATSSTRVFDALLALAREEGLAALIATHNMGLARRMDRVLALENGALRAGAA